jgi:hypothetical protein
MLKMKKMISLGLVMLVVLSVGAMAFADEVETTFQKGFGRGMNVSEDFERGSGLRVSMTDDEFEAYRTENRVNLSLNFQESAEIIEILAELTGDSVETIQTSGLTLHEYADNQGVLEAFQEDLLALKEANLNDLVANGTITQEKADFMLERMSLMDGSQLQERLGQKSGGRGFNGRGQGSCMNQ